MFEVGCRRACGFVAMALAVLAAACSSQDKPVELEPTRLVAVLPIEPAPRASQPDAGDEDGPRHPLPKDAGLAITGQIYEVLAQGSKFRFVADLTVSDAVQNPTVRDAPDVLAKAKALGQVVGSDAVIYGSVYRFRERVGTAYGATEPASVSFDLAFVDIISGEVLWEGSFSQTQESLSANLLNWWMFWRAGPHWFSARELAGLGVEKLLRQMGKAVGD